MDKFSHTDAAGTAKQSLAMGLASLGVSYERLADVCGVSASLCKAWADPARPHCPPAWLIYRLRQKLPALAAYVETQLEVYARTELKPLEIDFDDQQNVMLGVAARMISNHADSVRGDGEYDLAELDRNDAVMASVIENAQRSMAEGAKRRTKLLGHDRPSRDSGAGLRAVKGASNA